MEIFPADVKDLWNKWELRILVLLSLSWQVILIILGSRRKYVRGSLVRFIVWVAYLTADWSAATSLGILANSQGSETNVALQALWAPFLLLHLGGPDTITAYSLEDNSLWLRHLLGLVVQVILAFYIHLRSWSSTPLTFIAIPVFISGIIKYAERTWVLRSASPVQFEDSLLVAPTLQAADFTQSPADSELGFIHQGYLLFPMLKRLYADLSLQLAEGQRSYSLIVEGRDAQSAFKLVEVQLGFLYDMLYTKAPIIYSLPGLIFRFISVFSTGSALTVFVVFVDTNGHSRVDICITFCLFIGAISLELYAFISLIRSDWSMHWLTKSRSRHNLITQALHDGEKKWWHNLIKCLCHDKKRWSGCLTQHNLLSFCMKKRVAGCTGSDLLSRFRFWRELNLQRTWIGADNDLKNKIFEQLLKKRNAHVKSGFAYEVLKKLLSHKGDNALKAKRFYKSSGWSVEVEFDHSLLIWHVATDLCYYAIPEKDENKLATDENDENKLATDENDENKLATDENEPKKNAPKKNERKISKMLSDYMLYILLMRPFLLPTWIDRTTHVRDTFMEAIRILHRGQFPVKNNTDASKMLIQMYRQSHQPLKETSGKSVLLDGCRLASQLQTRAHPWEIIYEVWIEKLTYAASQCEWASHAHQLRRGGEFLTHVRVLMANLGLNQQFVIGQQEPHIESQNEGWGWVRCQILDPNK